jgi:hypothetical protein
MTTYSSGTGPQTSARTPREPEPTGWTGWVAFAGFIMILLGTLQAIEGLVALFQDEYFLVGKSGLTVHVDYTTWGWTHLILGAVIALAGLSLLAGKMWARIVAVIVAMLSAIVNIGFLSAYPVWSMIMIALDVFVIFAVTVHGREMQSV